MSTPDTSAVWAAVSTLAGLSTVISSSAFEGALNSLFGQEASKVSTIIGGVVMVAGYVMAQKSKWDPSTVTLPVAPSEVNPPKGE